MTHNIKQSQELAIQSAKKENRRANNLLLFFANWAEEAACYEIDDIIQSFTLMHNAFIESAYADNQDRRRVTQYTFNSINELLMQVKDAKEGSSLLAHKISQLLKIEKIVSHD